jgi:phytoene synthase
MTDPVAAPLTPKQIAKRSGSSFLVSFAFLSPERRRALTAVYAFFRVVDDAVDETADPVMARQRLEFWKDELDRVYAGTAATELGRELQSAVQSYGVRREHLEEVIAGVEVDLGSPCFADLEAMEDYCSKVASAVGLACLSVMGVSGADAERYADRLGKALQITNILRDLRADAEIDRIYVPRDWLGEAAVDIEWLRGAGPAEAYADRGPIDRLVQRLADLAETRFAQADEALPPDGMRRLLPARIMAGIYRDLLSKVRRRGGDLRSTHRLKVGTLRRCLIATGVWLGARR